MKVVGSALGNYIDHAAGRPSNLRSVPVARHLELLNRILAETVGITPGSTTACGLPEKDIVGIRTIDQQTICGSALSAEADIAESCQVAAYGGRQLCEIQEVAPIDGEIGNSAIVHQRGRL